MIFIEGLAGISAKIVADSIGKNSKTRITTFELIYPRFIHSEIMTHRVFSRNAASSRAIPIKRMVEQIEECTATFVHWGKNQAGMRAKEENTKTVIGMTREDAWCSAKNSALNWAELFDEAGYHKQVVNRLLEPFQMIKTLVTSTEFDNFFNLRCHEDAQPEIKELADCMHEAMKQSTPEPLAAGEWHTPYVKHIRDCMGNIIYLVSDIPKPANDKDTFVLPSVSLENAIKISCSCAAQVSYRQNDTSLGKAIAIYHRLADSNPVHSSAFEHCASPMRLSNKGSDVPIKESDWDIGTTHSNMGGDLWSGNFKHWVQYRQLIKNNVCNNYNKEKI